MLKPPAVSDRAVIGVVAPSSPVGPSSSSEVSRSSNDWGFGVRLGEHLYRKGRYTAGTVTERLSDFTALWADVEVEAIVARGAATGVWTSCRGSTSRVSAGGPRSSSARVTRPRSFRRWGCRESSPSTGQCWPRASRVPTTMSRIFLHLIQSPEPAGRLEAEGVACLHSGRGEGVLLGGCLSLLTALVGTPYLPDWHDTILFVEDTGVKPYQLDRMLTQIRLAGRFEGVRGIVFGQMPGCVQHPDQGYTLEEMLADWTAHLGVPVLFGYPSGHTVSPAKTLPLGVRARMDEEGLYLLEGAVS